MAEKSKAATSAIRSPAGDRIAKVLSRAGVASRREAERLIELGDVQVNGKTITSPALNVTADDRITVRGEPVGAPEPARLWLYYKPDGLVTTASDEKGRDTVFDHLPEDLPRVMSIGRLDLNSEGLLLLTNDGGLKRRLELPSTGWLRKYRVRVKGNPTDPDLEPLRRGMVVDGERFLPMTVQLDRHQGANAWLTIGIREGRNREIRRAIDSIGLIVNRLIRISYGPFRLGELQPGEVEEVKARTLRDQLGAGVTDAGEAAPKARGPRVVRPKPTDTSVKPPRGKSAPQLPPGDGLKTLSRAWKAVLAPADSEAQSERTRSSGSAAKPATKPRAKPAAKPSAKPGAKPSAKPGTPGARNGSARATPDAAPAAAAKPRARGPAPAKPTAATRNSPRKPAPKR